MADTKHAALEQEIRSHHERGDHERAADVAVRGYGGEIWSFLVAFHQPLLGHDLQQLQHRGVARGLP